MAARTLRQAPRRRSLAVVFVLLVVFVITVLVGEGDFNRAVVGAVRMLDIDPGAALVLRVEVQARELRTQRAVRGPACQAFARIQQVAILVQVLREPDVVIDAAVAVLDSADLGDEDAELTVGDAQDHDLAWYATQELPFLLDLL